MRKLKQKLITFDKFDYLVGIDWARDSHHAVILKSDGTIVADFGFDHSDIGWQSFFARIEGLQKVGVAIELCRGAAIEALLTNKALTIYPVHPKSAERYRERKVSSGNKTDPLDALTLANALRVDGGDWKALELSHPFVEQLLLLCRDEVELIGMRTQHVNQLQQALHEYYPAALEAFEDWTSPGAWDFIKTFPTPQALVKAGNSKWLKFLRAHRFNRQDKVQQRLEIFARADKFCARTPVVLAKSQFALSQIAILQEIENQILAFRYKIEELFEKCPQFDLFNSLPGAGPKLAPRLLSEIASVLQKTDSLLAVQCMAGTAPISYKSGKMNIVLIRRNCCKSFRNAMHQYANLSRMGSQWAAAYYYELTKVRKQSHSCALRALGQRWLKIIWAMCKSGKPYDESYHQQNMRAHGSLILTPQKSS